MLNARLKIINGLNLYKGPSAWIIVCSNPWAHPYVIQSYQSTLAIRPIRFLDFFQKEELALGNKDIAKSDLYIYFLIHDSNNGHKIASGRSQLDPLTQ